MAQEDHVTPGAHDRRYLIPVEGLGVPQAWTVGRVTFHPREAWSSLTEGVDFTVLHEDPWSRIGAPEIGSVAEVYGGEAVDDVIDDARAALDALRLFQFGRASLWPTWFGLPGDRYRSKINYVVIVNGGGGVGGRFRGDVSGGGFGTDGFEAWNESRAFLFLSDALADPRNEGRRRAVMGASLFARAAGDHRPELRLMGVIGALEAWLGRQESGIQTLRLARHVCWFGCGAARDELCGRRRTACPYLLLDPSRSQDRRRLTTLRSLAERDLRYECSEWFRFMDWYERRSAAAHGERYDDGEGVASQALYWVSHHLAEPILCWLADHENDPVADLEAIVARLDEPPDWARLLAQLDTEP